MWSENAETTVYAGDYQQAIFRFAGASPEVFQQLKADWAKPLTQSYRVPRAVLNHAMDVISKATDCRQFDYKPREGDEGEFFGLCGDPDLSLDGSHMIICRYRAQAATWAKELLKHGIPFKNEYRTTEVGWNPCSSKIWSQAQTYLRLVNGQSVDGRELRELLSGVKVSGNMVRGEKEETISRIDGSRFYSVFDLYDMKGMHQSFLATQKPLEDVFNKSKVTAYELLKKLWGTPEKILTPPQITVGTIHSVKGGEADNVWIEGRMGKGQVRRSYYGPETARNDEIRIAYVAVTRSRRRLGIVWARDKGVINPYLRGGL
jgi:superfamily I DNA/RNA helicase